MRKVQRRLLTEILQRHQGQDTNTATVEERRHLQGADFEMVLEVYI